MSILQFDNPLLLAFLLASFLLAVTPGPVVFFIVSRTLVDGRKAGLLTVAGAALGGCGNALGTALGLAALFSVSALAFTVVKLAGALYLFYLGWQALRASRVQQRLATNLKISGKVQFTEGVWVALLNPKTTLFFAAFLPQFMSPDESAFAQSVVFGLSFVFIAALTDSIYVLAAALVRGAMGNVGKLASIGPYAKAAVYIGLGAFTALGGQRAHVSPTL